MTRRTVAILAALAVACSQGGSPQTPAPLRIGGSAAVRDVVARLVEEYSAAAPGTRIEHRPSTHSGAGLEALRQGELDLVYLSREPTEPEQSGLYLYPFAKDPLVFAVHRGTGVAGLTTAQLRRLYAGEIPNWGELGGNDREVVLLDRPEYTSPKLLLRSGPFGNLAIAPGALVLESPDLMDEALTAQEGAIGYTSLRTALALGRSVDVVRLDGVYPDTDSVRASAYRLSRTLVFASREPLAIEAKRFLDFLGSPAGQAGLSARALVPLRRELLVAVPPRRNILAIEVKYGALARYLPERLGR
ncbi:MAG: substrate-binding domain-containing protein, partial [Deferrisomatales bacterium]